MNRQLPGAVARIGTALSFGLLAVSLIGVTTSAQDRLKTMPGYVAVPEDEHAAQRGRALGGNQRDLDC